MEMQREKVINVRYSRGIGIGLDLFLDDEQQTLSEKQGQQQRRWVVGFYYVGFEEGGFNARHFENYLPVVLNPDYTLQSYWDRFQSKMLGPDTKD